MTPKHLFLLATGTLAALGILSLTPPPVLAGDCGAVVAVRRNVVAVRRNVVVKKAVVVKAVAVADIYAPVAVFAPVALYSAAYQHGYVSGYGYGGAPVPPGPGPGPVPPAPAPAADMKALLDAINGVGRRLDSLDARLKALEGDVVPVPAARPGAGPAAPAAPAVPGGAAGAARRGGALSVLAIFQAKCASCHTEGTKTSGGLAMFGKDGKLLALTDRMWGKVGTRVSTGKMPPARDEDGKPTGLGPVTDEESAAIQEWLDSRK